MPDTPPTFASPSSPSAAEPWLEIVDADSPLILIAPHGGRAEPRTRAMLNPKVNDLHTADITRTLAARLGASALINTAMDRNRLDCNRISQIVERAPWLLELIAGRLAGIVARHGRATVLLVHGWNIIEPRIDLGLGLRNLDGELHPPGSACVSASDDFINGPLIHLSELLRGHGIKPSFGMRYPGGGLQNLLQAFTARHRESTVEPLRAISELACTGAVDALQLELSVALRMPGDLRSRCEDAIAAVFSPNGGTASPAPKRAPMVVNRVATRAPAKRGIGAAGTVAMPGRIGIEFFDPVSRLGAMASFDVGGAGMGARIMMLFNGTGAALFTAEGRPVRDERGVAHGPLSLTRQGNSIVLAFRGPAVIVPDSSAYLSIERALASGRLDGSMEVNVRLDVGATEFEFDRIVSPTNSGGTALAGSAAFGRVTGAVCIGGVAQPVNGVARAGMSFTGLGPLDFTSRRMVWASFDDSDSPLALEVRRVERAGESLNRSARILLADGWRDYELADLSIETRNVEQPPHLVSASIARSDGASFDVEGRVECFIPLSRPGPAGSRIYTSLGFATFAAGGRRGAGMFEYSRTAESVMTGAGEDSDDSDSE